MTNPSLSTGTLADQLERQARRPLQVRRGWLLWLASRVRALDALEQTEDSTDRHETDEAAEVLELFPRRDDQTRRRAA